MAYEGLQATVDGRNPTPQKKRWNDDSSVNTNNEMASHGFQVMQNFVHPQQVLQRGFRIRVPTILSVVDSRREPSPKKG